ncbi:FKBP-type peptidyl-prolyl cis-trans isomerase [Salmonella enterica subsp. arizonae]|uniref:FKBP-type peptidyl-prolyl cis-trans isomerase n=1 Tax=Salmonella enterica subsp. arizonae TaxID=59203 RepID=A0A2X4SYN3_SALER|nr:FKBP-type peptidyl-prolyl cis-trans isomerase [Salmonella enterica subsp. arizonae]
MLWLIGNHMLAGQNLKFNVEVVAIREATEEELAHGMFTARTIITTITVKTVAAAVTVITMVTSTAAKAAAAVAVKATVVAAATNTRRLSRVGRISVSAIRHKKAGKTRFFTSQ